MQQNLCYNCFAERQDSEPICSHCGYNNIENREKYPIALSSGSILDGRYIVGRVLGQGGFGITYLALDHSLNIKVAIKEYLPDSMATRMPGTTLVTTYSGERQEHFNYGSENFLDEARTLAKFIGNKNIAAVKSYFNENNTAYFVMDYIEGISFKNYIANKGGKVDYRDALRILSPVMDALAAVHREGFIHRDVTPDNIYITKDDEIKLLDFGSARYSLGDKSKSLDVVLKAGYAPKEQYLRRGKQGPYTDIYSLAACFYASITGFLPPESLERIEDDNLVDISVRGIKIPDTLEEAIIKGLELRAEDRFQSMEEFRTAITDTNTFAMEEDKIILDTSKSVEKTSSISATGVASTVPGIESLMKRGWLFLEDSDWKQADEYFDRILDINPEYAPAYVGKLCTELKVVREELLVTCKEPISENSFYKKALRFADTSYLETLERYNRIIVERFNETTYQCALSQMRTSENEQEFLSAAKLFDSIIKYKDSMEQSSACRNAANELKIKQECQLEEQRRMNIEAWKRAERYKIYCSTFSEQIELQKLIKNTKVNLKELENALKKTPADDKKYILKCIREDENKIKRYEKDLSELPVLPPDFV